MVEGETRHVQKGKDASPRAAKGARRDVIGDAGGVTAAFRRRQVDQVAFSERDRVPTGDAAQRHLVGRVMTSRRRLQVPPLQPHSEPGIVTRTSPRIIIQPYATYRFEFIFKNSLSISFLPIQY